MNNKCVKIKIKTFYIEISSPYQEKDPKSSNWVRPSSWNLSWNLFLDILKSTNKVLRTKNCGKEEKKSLWKSISFFFFSTQSTMKIYGPLVLVMWRVWSTRWPLPQTIFHGCLWLVHGCTLKLRWICRKWGERWSCCLQ